jgi:hypothetical protein
VAKKKTEVLFLELAVDLTQLEGLQENLTLTYLVEATKTLGLNESAEDRTRELNELMKHNAQKWKVALAKSVSQRAELCLRSDQQGTECDQIRFDFGGTSAPWLRIKITVFGLVQSDHLIADLHNRMKAYHDQLKSSAADSKAVHRKVTADYLVMRHNAKVAQEVLVRKQQEANAVRTIFLYFAFF